MAAGTTNLSFFSIRNGRILIFPADIRFKIAGHRIPNVEFVKTAGGTLPYFSVLHRIFRSDFAQAKLREATGEPPA
jgi:hypothetical protein